jgi:cytochrome b6-f complex iron-sulfur subunit
MEVIDIFPGREQNQPEHRRAGLFLIFGLSLLLLGFVLGWVILRFALPEPRFVLVGTLADFPADNEPYHLHSERRFFIVNTGNGLIVLSNKSPHEVFWHCPIHWNRADGTFMEPCGGSQFSLDGSYLSGPAPRAMSRHPIRIEGDKIWVDTTRLIEGEKVR